MKQTVICRDSYLATLQKCRLNGFVKIITGIRRCGKSFLLNTLYRQFLLDDGVPASHIISIDLDDDGIVHVGVIPFLLDRSVLSELMKG